MHCMGLLPFIDELCVTPSSITYLVDFFHGRLVQSWIYIKEFTHLFLTQLKVQLAQRGL